MNRVCIVLNLHSFDASLYLPVAYVVSLDESEAPLHILQRALPDTIASYGLALTPALERFFALLDGLAPERLEARFQPPKSKKAIPLRALLSDADTRKTISAHIHRLLADLLAAAHQTQIPVSLGAERGALVGDYCLRAGADILQPFLFFEKNDDGSVRYRLQLGLDGERWSPRERKALPLANTDPAWIAADGVLYCVRGINGAMLLPFRDKDEVLIPSDKTNEYFRRFIRRNAARARIEAKGFRVRECDEMEYAALEPFSNFIDGRQGFRLRFEYPDETRFYYGEKKEAHTDLHIPDHPDAEISITVFRRDARREADAAAALLAMGLREEDRCFFPPEAQGMNRLEACVAFVAKRRQALLEAGIRPQPFVADDKSIATIGSEIRVEHEADRDWFEVWGEVCADDYRFPFARLAPWLRRRDPYYPLPDGRYMIIPEEWMTRYAELADALQTHGETLRLPKALYTLLPAPLAPPHPDAPAPNDAPPLHTPESVGYAPSPALRATLRPYQQHGTRWLISHYLNGTGACLADDMGLGKTLQTIAFMLWLKERAGDAAPESVGAGIQLDLFQQYDAERQPLRALVILPSSLVFNWKLELRRFAPSLFVYEHTGPKRLRNARVIGSHDVTVSTYHTVRQDADLLQGIDWRLVALDESQQIKNHTTEVSQVARSLRAGFRISLSGTPIENSLADLWTQMDFINPGALGSFKEYSARYLKADASDRRAALFRMVRPFFLRRLKEEVAPELPPLGEQEFFSQMTTKQTRRYEQVKSAMRNQILSLFDDPRTRMQALQALTRLRQIANHPILADPEYVGDSGKFDDVWAQWSTVRTAGHKALFFSSFEQHLMLFRKKMDAEGIPYAWLSGGSSAQERAAAVSDFQQNPHTQAFLMTLKAGGVGLNLTAADYVFLLDPWWNPAAESQAIARAHRIGQERPVTALRFISRDTVEEKIRQLQEQKRQLSRELFDPGDPDTPILSREEFRSLLD